MTRTAVSGWEEVRVAYLKTLLEGDRHAALAVIDAACQEGFELGRVYVEVFQPALEEIGALWQRNEISVADEHLAAGITQAAMARLFERSFRWGRREGRSLIAACADLERHELGLRMICDLLELNGWDTIYLGAAVPVDSLVVMVGRKRPDAVALSAAITPHLPRLRLMIEQIRSLIPDPPLILAGGRAFAADPSLAVRLGADLTAPDAVQAVELLARRFDRG